MKKKRNESRHKPLVYRKCCPPYVTSDLSNYLVTQWVAIRKLATWSQENDLMKIIVQGNARKKMSKKMASAANRSGRKEKNRTLDSQRSVLREAEDRMGWRQTLKRTCYMVDRQLSNMKEGVPSSYKM